MRMQRGPNLCPGLLLTAPSHGTPTTENLASGRGPGSIPRNVTGPAYGGLTFRVIAFFSCESPGAVFVVNPL